MKLENAEIASVKKGCLYVTTSIPQAIKLGFFMGLGATGFSLLLNFVTWLLTSAPSLPPL